MNQVISLAAIREQREREQQEAMARLCETLGVSNEEEARALHVELLADDPGLSNEDALEAWYYRVMGNDELLAAEKAWLGSLIVGDDEAADRAAEILLRNPAPGLHLVT